MSGKPFKICLAPKIVELSPVGKEREEILND